MLYVVTKPSKPEKGIFLSMQGGAEGCLYGNRGPVQDEETLIANAGPSEMHPSFMIRSTDDWTKYGLKVIHPNCPNVSFDSNDSIYTSAINKILIKENPHNLPVFVAGLSIGSIRAANIASRLGQKIRGTIILSGSTDDTHDGTMFDSPLKQANSSFLMIMHKNDKCSSSESLDGLKSFSEELTGVNDKKIVQVEGGFASMSSGRHAWCDTHSHHGFWGMHNEVLKIIKSWILKRI
ncbi:MAG: hypothetical protein VX780_09280, partial [Pseudomonadota bacterium]|nr:hypothetical protein [Pseudomonadota bacterium]